MRLHHLPFAAAMAYKCWSIGIHLPVRILMQLHLFCVDMEYGSMGLAI